MVGYKAVTAAQTRDSNDIMIVITLELEMQPFEGPGETFVLIIGTLGMLI